MSNPIVPQIYETVAALNYLRNLAKADRGFAAADIIRQRQFNFDQVSDGLLEIINTFNKIDASFEPPKENPMSIQDASAQTNKDGINAALKHLQLILDNIPSRQTSSDYTPMQISDRLKAIDHFRSGMNRALEFAAWEIRNGDDRVC